MFDIGWTELLVIGIVALIVVGPKDLPKMFRTLGQITAKMRNMAREFQRAMDDAADATGVKDVAADLRKATSAENLGLDELRKMKQWDPLRDAPKPAAHPHGKVGDKVGDKAREKVDAETAADQVAAPAQSSAPAQTSEPAQTSAAEGGESPAASPAADPRDSARDASARGSA
ncbi:MAG: Sec-independent protein translocase protein TatB [Roseinatronobacter sp.]